MAKWMWVVLVATSLLVVAGGQACIFDSGLAENQSDSMNCTSLYIGPTSTLCIENYDTVLSICVANTANIRGTLSFRGARHQLWAGQLQLPPGGIIYFDELAVYASLANISGTMNGDGAIVSSGSVWTPTTVGYPGTCTAGTSPGGCGGKGGTHGGYGSDGQNTYSNFYNSFVYDTHGAPNFTGSPGGLGFTSSAQLGGGGGGYLLLWAETIFMSFFGLITVEGTAPPTMYGGAGSGGAVTIKTSLFTITDAPTSTSGPVINLSGGSKASPGFGGGGGGGVFYMEMTYGIVDGKIYPVIAGGAGISTYGQTGVCTSSDHIAYNAPAGRCALGGSSSSSSSGVTQTPTTIDTDPATSSSSSTSTSTTSGVATTTAATTTAPTASASTSTTSSAPSSTTTSPSISTDQSSFTSTTTTTSTGPSAIVSASGAAASGNSGTAVGVAAGVLVAVIVIGVGLLFVYMRRRRQSTPARQPPPLRTSDGGNQSALASTVSDRSATSSAYAPGGNATGEERTYSYLLTTTVGSTSELTANPAFGQEQAGGRPVEKTAYYKLRQSHRSTQVAEMLDASSTSLLGSGLTADVYRVKYGKQWVAVKKFKHESSAALAEFHAEVSVFTRVGEAAHPHLLGLHFICSEPDLHAIVVDLADGGSLKDCVGGALDLSPDARRQALAGVASGMAFLHSHGIAHLDLKPANVLRMKGGAVKVADFGASMTWDQSDEITMTAFVGTPHYAAPERLAGNSRIRLRPADVYSFGVTAWSVLSGKNPFPGTPVAEICTVVSQQPTSSLFPLTWQGHPGLHEVVCSCCDKDPAARPSFETIVKQFDN